MFCEESDRIKILQVTFEQRQYLITRELKIPTLKVKQISFQKGFEGFLFFSKSEIQKVLGGIFMQKVGSN